KLNFCPIDFSNLNLLELTNYTMTTSTPEAFDGCGGKLKILKLKNMHMSDDVINGVLRKCLGFKTLEINNLWLKFLELGWLIVNKVDLSVEGLETLVVDSLMYPSKDLKIYTINPRILHVSCNSIAQRMRIRSSRQQTFFVCNHKMIHRKRIRGQIYRARDKKSHNDKKDYHNQ
ncbi:hypothetical protein HN51_044393, partial [Arachis hypogaea]